MLGTARLGSTIATLALLLGQPAMAAVPCTVGNQLHECTGLSASPTTYRFDAYGGLGFYGVESRR